MERSRPRAWLIALGIAVLAFAGTVLVLNLTVYSASGFVSSYLDTLARHDVAGALATPGVSVPAGGSRALLRPDAMGDLTDIHLVSDTASADGSHRVVYSYRAGTKAGRSSFTVQRDGTNLGLFSAWRFSTSPIATLSVTPQHDGSFSANGFDLSPKAGQDVATRYSVLVPSGFALSHRSKWLTATTKTSMVSAPGSRVDANVNVQANTAFVKEAQKEIDAYLLKCVKQKVLLPTGCPMGQEITDRIQDAPTWSMVTDPVIQITPGNAPATWTIPPTAATAHLVVTVQSIFDGSVSTFDRDVPFDVSFVVTFQADGTLLLVGQF
ncbi:MAG: hypothetical protein JWN80_750 [Microbacteriaceae bacterium]|jgi:hypothetical protein|nr:hypothetical protein [Microbacteriaceae bacterium]